jgi:hypothetical protein
LRSPWCIYSSHPHVLANVTNAAPVQVTVEIHHAALSSLPRPLRLRPPGSALLASPGCHKFHLDQQRPPTYPSDWLLLSRATGLAPVTTAKMTSTITLGASGRGISPCRPRKDTGGRPHHHPYDYSAFLMQTSTPRYSSKYNNHSRNDTFCQQPNTIRAGS